MNFFVAMFWGGGVLVCWETGNMMEHVLFEILWKLVAGITACLLVGWLMAGAPA